MARLCPGFAQCETGAEPAVETYLNVAPLADRREAQIAERGAPDDNVGIWPSPWSMEDITIRTNVESCAALGGEGRHNRTPLYSRRVGKSKTQPVLQHPRRMRWTCAQNLYEWGGTAHPLTHGVPAKADQPRAPAASGYHGGA